MPQTHSSTIRLFKEKDWKGAFKSIAVYSCICELSRDEFKELLKKNDDLSLIGEAEILDVLYTKKAETVGREYARKITPVFSDDSEFAGRKAIFSSCLFFMEDKNVSNLINDEYKKYKKGD